MIDLMWSFLVVNNGKFSRKSNRVCAPKIDNVPVPGGSAFGWAGVFCFRMAMFEHEPEEIMILAHAGNYRSDAIRKTEKSFWTETRAATFLKCRAQATAKGTRATSAVVPPSSL